jgi:hypothetical protein
MNQITSLMVNSEIAKQKAEVTNTTQEFYFRSNMLCYLNILQVLNCVFFVQIAFFENATKFIIIH